MSATKTLGGELFMDEYRVSIWTEGVESYVIGQRLRQVGCEDVVVVGSDEICFTLPATSVTDTIEAVAALLNDAFKDTRFIKRVGFRRLGTASQEGYRQPRPKEEAAARPPETRLGPQPKRRTE